MGQHNTSEKILVTGGGGFLGHEIIKLLKKLGYSHVHSYSRSYYPALTAMGVVCHQGDLTDYEKLKAAATGAKVIFHVAAKAGVWGEYADYYQTNVIGTRNVLKVCQDLGVERLIYTSSPSVVFSGKDQANVDETPQYPDQYLAPYPATKAIAEREVLAAASSTLATVALRPHLIWGPYDQHLVPRLIERGRANKLVLIGDGQNPVDAVYITNAAQAHLDALVRLAPNSPISGKAYFITNHEPWPMAKLMNRILATAGIKPVTKKIPLWLAYGIGATLEALYKVLGKTSEPRLTRFVALQLGTSHWYNNQRARQELGYQPQVSMEEGLSRLQASLKSGHYVV